LLGSRFLLRTSCCSGERDTRFGHELEENVLASTDDVGRDGIVGKLAGATVPYVGFGHGLEETSIVPIDGKG